MPRGICQPEPVPPAILPVVQDVGIDVIAYHQHFILVQAHIVECHLEKRRRRLADDHRLAAARILQAVNECADVELQSVLGLPKRFLCTAMSCAPFIMLSNTSLSRA